MSAACTRSAEHVIVGAGLIGLAVAYELLRRGATVRVLERDRPGQGATAAAGGMLAPVFESELEHPDLIALARESLDSYPRFVGELERLTGMDCHYDGAGTLCIGVRADHRAELGHLEATLRSKGLAADRLDAGAVLALEPHLTGRVTGGLRVDGDHQVDPRRLTAALVEGIRRLGGRIESGVCVAEVHAVGGAVREVRGNDASGASFRLPADRVVLAAGAWSGREIRLPIGELGLRPVKGQLVRLRGARLLRHVVRTPEVYLIPRQDGELLVGATLEETGFDLSTTAGAAMDLLRHAWEALPGIYDLELTELCAGLRSALDDHLPAIGPTAIRGLCLAVGHYRSGVLLAPATATHLAEWLTGGGEWPAGLAPFDPRRMASGAGSVRRVG